MQVKDIMTQKVIPINASETVEVAARYLARHNIGALPVCDAAGKLCGMITDRDLVIRCMAAAKNPAVTTVREVMTGQVLSLGDLACSEENVMDAADALADITDNISSRK